MLNYQKKVLVSMGRRTGRYGIKFEFHGPIRMRLDLCRKSPLWSYRQTVADGEVFCRQGIIEVLPANPI